MHRSLARVSTWLGIGIIASLLHACAAPIAEPSPPAMLSATAVIPPPQSTATLSPSPVPPTPTPVRPVIVPGNVGDLQTLYTFANLGNNIRAVAFDPTSSYIAAITGGSSQGVDHRLRLWSTETGELVAQSGDFLSDGWDLTFSPRGDTIAVGLNDGRVVVYSLPGLDILASFSHSGQVNSVAISPDGTYLAAGSAEADGGMLYIWNLEQGVQVRRSWTHAYSVPGLDFSPNGQTIATGAVDRSVKVWQLSDGQLLQTLSQPGQGTDVGFTSTGQWLGSAMCAQSTASLECVDGQVWLWDAGNWSVARKLAGPRAWVEEFDVSPDGALMVGAGRDTAIYLWDLGSSSVIRSILHHRSSVSSVAISPDGRFLASASGDESIVIWAVSP